MRPPISDIPTQELRATLENHGALAGGPVTFHSMAQSCRGRRFARRGESQNCQTSRVRLRLRGEGLGFWVAVDAYRLSDRWIAVAELAGEPEIGAGDSLRAALADAIAPLGWKAMNALLADAAITIAGGREAPGR